MEALKSFQNLSEIEKILLFQRLFNRNESDSEEKAPDDSEKSNLSLFLDNFKDVHHKDIPEDKVKEEISKGKQRTLDNWLIKRGNVSSPKSHVGETSRQIMTQSCETSHACNKSEVTSHTVEINRIDIDSVDASRKRKRAESRIFNKKSDMNKNVSEKKELIVSPRTTEKSIKTNEKYNLRSKRKFSEKSTVSKGGKSGIKCLKIADIQGNSPVITDYDISNQVNNFESSITSPSSPNYEAFCLLLRKCQEIGINVMDVLKNKNVQTLLNDHKNVNDDAVVFIGSFKTKTGETLPIVHLAQSKTELLKKLCKLKR